MSTALTTPVELREYREGAGVLLGDLAARLGMNDSVLSKIEKGRRAMPADLPKRYRTAVVEITRERARFARGEKATVAA